MNLRKNAFMSSKQFLLAVSLGVASSVASAQDSEVEPTRWSLEGIASSAARNSAVPPLSQNLESQRAILLTLSVDHQLFFSAYNDYDDIYQEEGELFRVPETTYTHEFTYTGYYDPNLCYEYSDDDGVFRAVAAAENKYCPDGEADGGWSGNFLNWATMTRMDMVRFVLYGGYRSVDEGAPSSAAGRTVLERAYLPQDAHSFAKFYPNTDDDFSKLTSGLTAEACDEEGSLTCGYTFCNTSQPPADTGTYKGKTSQDVEVMRLPPLMRAVSGNYSLWASNERYQCVTKDEVPAIDRQGLWLELDNRGHNGNNAEATGIKAYGNPPSSDSIVDDFIVRVEVCHPGGAVREEFCEAYSDGNFKPVGLLQEQGGNGEVHFGLLTGSYKANKSFGVLRKSVSSFADEIRPDGTFVFPPLASLISSSPPAPSLENSIVGNLNALRIVDYLFRSAGDDDKDRSERSGTYNEECKWELNEFGNGKCRNWGNPLSELLAESYLYFGKRNKMAVNESDAGLLPGLTVADWPTIPEGDAEDPDLACMNMNVVGFNSSAVSHDAGVEVGADSGFNNLAGKTIDSLFGFGTGTVQGWTDRIGAVEIDAEKTYFVGRVNNTATAAAGQCTAKEIEGGVLSAVSGICPEAPNADGTYWGAGLAFFANTEGVASTGTQRPKVATYGVDLAAALPNITVSVPPDFDHTVRIIPSCKNRGSGSGEEEQDKGNCTLVDFKPVTVWAEDSGVYTAKYYVGWEDSEQGGDYDLDLSGTITVKYNPLNARPFSVLTQIIYESAYSEMHFGFVISGTDLDGVHFPSKVMSNADEAEVYGRNDEDRLDHILRDETTTEVYKREAIAALERVEPYTISPECEASMHCQDADNGRIQEMTFSVSASSNADFLRSPLFYAAKWGAFDRSKGDDPEEAGWDGSSYAEVSDPSRLKGTLGKVLDNIIDKPVAGTGASVATTALTGEGIILSTLFLPKVGEGANAVDWVGRLNGLFRADDETWEDSAEPFGVRTDADNVVRFSVEDNKTVFHRYSVTRDVETGAITLADVGSGNALPYSELKPVWNANDMLAGVNNFEQNRPFTSQAANRRYIFTAIAEENGQLTNEQVVPFVADNFDGDSPLGLGANNHRLLDVGNAENAKNVVNFVRGVEGIEGFRNRSVTVGAPDSAAPEDSEGDDLEGNDSEDDAAEDEESTAETSPWLLGDIAHSTPALVGRPSAIYDSRRLNDLTYSQFRAQYANRRLVTYVGANDGMLHAFNNGFVQPYRSNLEADADIVNSLSYGLTPPDGSTVTEHALGAELWSYVPYNLLPHLKWLTDPNYQHVYYVDSSVNEFDVNIFPASATHPEGWGTIIVVGMRFGGAPVSLDVGEEANRQFRSAYIVFDVTNPEAPPKLLGEITHPDLGYTLGDIDIVSFRKPRVNGTYAAPLTTNKWYLTFGSGPQEISDASSNQNASLFFLDLNKLAGGEVDLQKHELTGASRSYVGGITAVDWDDDFNDDMLYFGTVGAGTGEADTKGSLMQAALTYGDDLSVTASKLLDADLPFSREPLAVKESTHGGMWVYASTGKFLTQAHLDDIDANGMFGVRVNRAESDATQPRWTTTITYAEDELVNMADYNVRTEPVLNDDNEVVSRIFTITRMGETVVRDELEQLIRNNHGWRRSFSVGELSDTRPFYAGSTLGISSFLPGVSGCSPDAKSRLYILNLFNGLPQTDAASFVLANSGSDGGVLTDVGNSDSGDVGLYTEYDTKSNDASLGPTPVIPGADGSFDPALPELMDGIPGRRSWREVPMDELGL